MKTIRSAVISFELVAIPVGVASVKSSTKEPTFKTLHTCGTPVEVRTAKNIASKKETETSTTGDQSIVWCPGCDEEADETLRGYEYAKGQFIHFTQDELDAIKPEREATIELTKFVRVADIRQVMVSSTYWLIPSDNPKLAEAYGLLYQSLAETKKAGFGFQALWGKEHPCVIVPNQDYPTGGVLQMLVLELNDDLIPPDFSAPIPGREAKRLAKQIIDSKTGEFDPSKDLVSKTRQRLEAMIAARIEGQELPAAPSVVTQEASTDLMDALKRSYEEVQEKKTPKKKPAAEKKEKVKK